MHQRKEGNTQYANINIVPHAGGGSLTYKDIKIGEATVTANNYKLIANVEAPEGKIIASCVIKHWSVNTGAFSVAISNSSEGRELYLIAANGTKVTGLQIRVFFIGSNATEEPKNIVIYSDEQTE